MRSLLVGVAPADPLSLAGSTLVLVMAAGAAALGPAVRAAGADPLESIRAD
jgi:hypothetical protein